MNYEEKYKEAVQKIKDLIESCKENGWLQIPALEKDFELIFPELAESEDDRIIREIKQFLKHHNGWIKEWIDWLEKQKDISSTECVFRPTAGCDIESAAKQAVRQQQSGNKIVLAFNGAYIPVEGKTDNEIVKEYLSWLEKQSDNQNWKPSKEQINALEHFVRSITESGYASPYEVNTKLIYSLLSDLNKRVKQSGQKHLELKAGHWYFCHSAYCSRADHLTVKEGEKFQCEKDGVVRGFVIKKPREVFQRNLCSSS